MTTDPWGRVDDEGTVYVRTSEGERVVGSWQAGAPEEALTFFRRKYDSLVTEVELLENRLRNTDLSASAAMSNIDKLRDSVREAHAVGDLDSLMRRLDALADRAEERKVEQKQAQEQARGQAREVKERIVAEAERVAVETTHWKSGGERMLQLIEEWKKAPRADRPTEQALWKRMSAARNSFSKRRKAYFANLDQERESVRAEKERIVVEAEALSGSTDWGATARAYRDLMQRWKSSGRADRASEDKLWARFKAAQDTFFDARNATFAERDAELRVNAEAKERILAEARAEIPEISDPRRARARLREFQDAWEEAGELPRDVRDQLEGAFRQIEDGVRRAEDAEWERSNPEARARARDTAAQLASAIADLETKLDKARAKGDERRVREYEDALEARRSWLAEAEKALNELS
ncbi:DNA repair ATPase [Glycomyces fuscus]|nr:DNA repair ATPase [Glycomyces fuscus]